MVSVQSQLVSFIQKQNGIQWNTGLLFENEFFIARPLVLNKIENIFNVGYWKLSEIAKNNFGQEKPICLNRKN